MIYARGCAPGVRRVWGGAMRQSRAGSAVESLLNVAIGYGVAVAAQVLIFPAFGITVDLPTNLNIAFCFTVVSLLRSYLIRRIFNAFQR